jgi:hypothetical protein
LDQFRPRVGIKMEVGHLQDFETFQGRVQMFDRYGYRENLGLVSFIMQA